MSVAPGTILTTSLDRLRSARAFIFDMDGVLYRGHAPLPGVGELFAAMMLRDVQFRLATNNSTLTPQQYVEKLSAMGIEIDAGHIVTSGTATRGYLEQTMSPGSKLYVIGEPALFDQLFASGHLLLATESDDHVDAVVMGLDRDFTYAKLYAANAAIRGGARFVATNTDLTLPTEAGLVPGCGSIIASVSAATGQQPEVVGKPEGLLYELAAAQMGVPVTETVAIGDRLDTDIAAADRSGALSVLVLTGVSTREEIVDSPVKPDLAFSDLNAVLDALI